jgi:translation initiation factor 2 subunit 2
MTSYEELLSRGIKKVPKGIQSKERFEIPLTKGYVEKTKTIITNFMDIVEKLRREPKQLLKYLQRELAAPGFIDKRKLILGRKISSHIINEKIKKYANDFVICKDCNKPDTKLIRENRILLLKCQACGAKHPVKARL